MKIVSLLIAGAVLLPAPLIAGNEPAQTPSCSKAAAAAYVKLPPLALRCGEDSLLACSSDNAAAADQAACAAAGPAYAKVLQRVLRPAWWTLPAEEVEACREQKEGGSPDEGAGEAIQGDGRVRLLVLGNGCGNSAGVYNLVLAVKSDRGIAVKVLALDYAEQRQEAPFGLVVLHNGDDTLALVSESSHDMHIAGTDTTAYEVDIATGGLAEYPLFVTESGPHSKLGSTEPTINFEEDESSALVVEGKPAQRFVQYSYLKDCPGEGACAADEVVEKRGFTWNGAAFVVDHYEEVRHAYQRRLAAHRECLKAKFDPKTGTAACPADVDYDDNCESNNDLSYLSYKAGNLDRARRYAAKALEECKDDPKELAAAQFNDRRARGK